MGAWRLLDQGPDWPVGPLMQVDAVHGADSKLDLYQGCFFLLGAMPSLGEKAPVLKPARLKRGYGEILRQRPPPTLRLQL